jgi:hypothetical protein
VSEQTDFGKTVPASKAGKYIAGSIFDGLFGNVEFVEAPGLVETLNEIADSMQEHNKGFMIDFSVGRIRAGINRIQELEAAVLLLDEELVGGIPLLVGRQTVEVSLSDGTTVVVQRPKKPTS